jgi:hypothetical protein
MRKLLSILFALISFTSFGQTTRVLAGYDAATLRPGTIYRDTLISLPYTAGKYITGYGTVGSLPDTTRGYFSGTTNRIAYNITTGVFDIGSDVVTLLGTQTLTNKTLISPIFNTSSTSGYVWTATNTTGAGAWAAAAGGGGSAAGSSTWVQYNNAGAFGADSAFRWKIIGANAKSARIFWFISNTYTGSTSKCRYFSNY